MLGGLPYKLTTVSSGRLALGQYEVVPDGESAGILTEMARLASSLELATALKAVVELLTSTPSQLIELVKKREAREVLDWIEFEIANDDGTPTPVRSR